MDWQPNNPEIASLKEFVEQEYQAHREGREALYDLPIAERVASGTAIAGLRFLRVEEGRKQKLLVFACAKNESRFRPGTRIRISHGDPRAAAARLELVDDHFDGKTYTLRLSAIGLLPETFESSEPWVLDEDIFDLLDVQMEILRRAEAKGLSEWLAGTEPPRDFLASPEQDISPFAQSLTGSIREAFDQALGAQPYFAVQGPPGSGKTHLLARLALHYALREQARVLVTAVSHQAIHQALGETYWVAEKMATGDVALENFLGEGFYKLGSSKGANEGLPEGVRATLRAPSLKCPVIVGATVYAAMHASFASNWRRVPFNVVLFDEAGQAPMILGLAARLLAPKTVFIGDDAQLPPIWEHSEMEFAGSFARSSVLEFLRKHYKDPWLLTETRRLNRELCTVVSDCFYRGTLQATSEAEGRSFCLAHKPGGTYTDILSPKHSLVFVDVPHRDSRSVSDPEALWAAGIVRELLRCGLPAQEIGVIAPYRAQCNRIRFLLEDIQGLLCATVERFQGQEREIVVISLTSSKPSYLSRLAGFLFNPNRLNVAISRARTKVVLLGSRAALLETAESVDPDIGSASGLGLFRKILSLSYVVEGLPTPTAETLARVQAVEGEAFEPGDLVEHAKYGLGRVLSKSLQLIDNRREWVNEIRFPDGVRQVVPLLSRPPIRRIQESAASPDSVSPFDGAS